MHGFAIALALGATSAIFIAPPLSLASEPEVRALRVKVTDEDFASAESLARLQSKLRRAAYKVCAKNDSFNGRSTEERACIAKALDGADSRLAQIQARYGIAYGG